MKLTYIKGAALCIALCAGVALTACVDEEYDLSKELDLTVGLGGDHLTLPASSTDPYALENILDLSGTNVVIDPSGNYVFVENGTATNSSLTLDPLTVEQEGTSTTSSLIDLMTVPAAVPAGALFGVEIGGKGDGLFIIGNDKYVNTIDIKNRDDVPKALKSLSEAYVDMTQEIIVKTEFTDYNGPITVKKGFKIDFDPTITLSPVSDFVNVENGHTVVFNRDQSFSGQIAIVLNISKIEFKNGQGLQKDHSFKYKTDIVSSGTLLLDNKKLVPNTHPTLTLSILTQSDKGAKVQKIKGVVDPDFNIDISDFNVTNVPEFLKNPKTRLVFAEPKLFVNFENNSPADINISAVLTSVIAGKETANVTVPEFTVKPGHNSFYFAPKKDATLTEDFIQIADIANLVERIPDKIRVNVTKAQVKQTPIEIELGRSYTLNIDENINMPLVFAKGTEIYYEENSGEWYNSEEELDAYSFNKAILTANVVNTIPMDVVLTDETKVLYQPGHSGNYKLDIVEGKIAGAYDGNPTTTPIRIDIQGDLDETLRYLNGMQYGLKFIAEHDNNQTLNIKQSLKFEDVKITIEGGIAIDLNKIGDSDEK